MNEYEGATGSLADQFFRASQHAMLIDEPASYKDARFHYDLLALDDGDWLEVIKRIELGGLDIWVEDYFGFLDHFIDEFARDTRHSR